MPNHASTFLRRRPADDRRRGKTDRGRPLGVERLEARLMLRADLVISELVADNVDELIDFQGKDPDWFEIHNRGTSRVDLKGWHVTDDAALPTKWQIPVSTILEPGDRLVVFASNQNLVSSGGEYHANFRLNRDGNFLALVDPAGDIIDSFAPAYPPLATNVSYGIDENVQVTVSIYIH